MSAFLVSYRVPLALACILVVAFTLRFAAFDHPLAANAGEGLRDFFVAKHALTYGEWPISGYQNSLSSIDNSPFYYYFVIVLVALGNTFVGTEVVYLVVVCLSILALFALTRALFGTGAGLVAALLMAVGPNYYEYDGKFLWPPYVVPLFVITAFLLLTHGYKRTRPLFIIMGGVSMLLAVATHQSVLPLLMVYGVLALIVFSQQPYPFKQAGRAVLIGVGALIFLFLPSVLSMEGSFSWGSRLHTYFPVTTVEAIDRSVPQLTYMFGIMRGAATYPIVFALTALLAAWFFSSRTITREKKVLVLILAGSVVFQIVVTILVDPEGVPRHFSAVLFMVPVILGALITAPFTHARYVVPFSLMLTAVLLYGCVTDSRAMVALSNIPVFARPNALALEEAGERMAEEAMRIKEEEGRTDYSFFDVYVLGNTRFQVSSYVFWEPLERNLGVELIQGPDTSMRSRVVQPDEKAPYLFIGCMKHMPSYTKEECLQDVLVDRPEFSQPKPLYESDRLSVYLAERVP